MITKRNNMNVPEVTFLLDGSNFLSTARNLGTLVATAFASTCGTRKGSFKLQKRSLRIEFFHIHLESMARIAAHARKTVRIFQRMGHLLIPNKVSAKDEEKKTCFM